MKTILATIAVVSILAVGTLAFAHGTGGWGGGQMMGSGYGGQMMGSGYGGQMMGSGYGGHMGQGYGKGGGPGAEVNQEFLDKTVDLRKALHDKKFEYREVARNPETSNKKLMKIEKDIFDIQTKIREKAPRITAYGGYNPCWER